MAQSEDAEPPTIEENVDKPASKTTSQDIINDDDDDDKKTTTISDNNANDNSQIINTSNDSMIEDETMPSLVSITSFSSGIISSKQENQIDHNDKKNVNCHNDNDDDDDDNNDIEAFTKSTTTTTTEENECVEIVSSDSEVENQQDSENDDDDNMSSGRRNFIAREEDDESDNADNERYYSDEIDSTESIGDDNESDRSDDMDDMDDYGGIDHFDQSSYDGTVGHEKLLKSYTHDDKERAKSLQDLFSPEKLRSNGEKIINYHKKQKIDEKKYTHADVVVDDDDDDVVEEVEEVEDLDNNEEDEHEHDDEDEDDDDEEEDYNDEDDDDDDDDNDNDHDALHHKNSIYNRLMNKNNIELIPINKNNQDREQHVEVATAAAAADDDDDDIIIDDQPFNNDCNNKPHEIQTMSTVTIETSQNFITQSSSHLDFMMANKCNDEFIINNTEIPNVEEIAIEDIAMETTDDPMTTTTQLLNSQMEFKIDNVMSLGSQSIDNNETVVQNNNNNNLSLYEAQIQQLTQQNDNLKKCLNDTNNEYKLQLSNINNKYKIQVDENNKLNDQIKELQKLLSEAEKNISNLNKKTKMIDFTIQTQIDENINKIDKTKIVSNVNEDGGTSIKSVTSTNEQWTNIDCNSPVVSLKAPNVDDLLNNTDDNSFIIGGSSGVAGNGPTINKNKQLSNAFFTSSRILETLANITQGRHDPAKIHLNNSNNINNCSIDSDTATTTTTTTPQHQGQLNSLLVDDSTNARNNNYFNNNKSTSRKRKAESPLTFDNSYSDDNNINNNINNNNDNNCTPSFKIPSLIPDHYRRAFNSSSNADGLGVGGGGGGDCAHNKNDNEKINKNNNNNETGSSEELLIGDGIKCFVYQDDNDDEERSFLIQAEEPLQMNNKNGIVRQCGPFLLKNIEVRMSEVNGTINIWGKEIKTANNTTTTDVDENLINYGYDLDLDHDDYSGDYHHHHHHHNYDNDDDDEEEEEDDEEEALLQQQYDGCSMEFNNDRLWKQTPSKKMTNSFSCSTSKKMMMPPLSRASPTPAKRRRMSRDSFDQQHQQQQQIKLNQQRRREQMTNRFGSMPNLDCNSTSQYNYNIQQQQKFMNIQRAHQKAYGPINANSHKKSNSCSNYDNDGVNVSTKNYLPHGNKVHGSPGHCLHSNKHRENPIESNYLGDNDPLIYSGKSCSIASDIKQRRVRGKKVCGILMDFIKGCGPCKNPSLAGHDNDQQHYKQTEPMAVPNIRITSATGLSNNKHSRNNNNNTETSSSSLSSSQQQQQQQQQQQSSCNNPRTKPINIAEITKQIQAFQDDMEKMRSKSNVFLDIFKDLQGTDAN
ncbi:probable serine/threonine-protein kinase DDB_G0282963 [Aphidius gifuensis]|uniref:probable serine/threonine-protein kinase DDB_G0282963 n=1 Tax=Aphidius gifuensis TaxID=684658 RepID=UPI001CDBC7B2|nr:probable serine/threonine-protein kinase DDB_G0282963 [Aphidius gifuensis]